MKRSQQRKARKQIKRAKADHRRKLDQQAVKRFAEKRKKYPKFRILAGNLNPVFVDCIRAAVQQIDFDDQNQFRPFERDYFRTVRSSGANSAAREFYLTQQTIAVTRPQLANEAEFHLRSNLGDQILDRLPDDIRNKMIPFGNFQFNFVGQEIVIKCEALHSIAGPGGRIYHSQYSPKILISDQEFTVGFSRHAIDAVSLRLRPDKNSYGAANDLFGFFDRCVYFEPVTLYPDQPGLLMYDWCHIPLMAQYELYVQQILGEDLLDWEGGLPFYRLGYCPLVIENGFAKAKTFLCPGYTATPEYGLLLKANNIDRSERDRLIDISKRTNSVEALANGLNDHIKWFHQNGIPQVVQFEHQVFRYGNQQFKQLISNFPPLLRRKQQIESM